MRGRNRRLLKLMTKSCRTLSRSSKEQIAKVRASVDKALYSLLKIRHKVQPAESSLPQLNRHKVSQRTYIRGCFRPDSSIEKEITQIHRRDSGDLRKATFRELVRDYQLDRQSMQCPHSLPKYFRSTPHARSRLNISLLSL